MDSLRPYQQVAVDSILASKARRILAVCPTGGGKTILARAVIERRGVPALFVVHTVDLLAQARRVMPPGVEVRTIQSLLRREDRPDVGFIVLDEARHFVADQFRTLAEAYPDVPILGLDATPQRADGLGLGTAFDELIVVATYPDLVRDGWLVPARVLAPAERLRDGLALRPVEAYLSHGEGRSGFCYVRSVEDAYATAEAFNEAGVPAACVEGESDKVERAESLARLGRDLKMLVNVFALSEGVDIPAASIAILARGVGSVSAYLQICGRVLRPHVAPFSEMREPCRSCGEMYGRIEEKSGQSCVYCKNCGSWVYNAPSKETAGLTKRDALILDLSGVSHLYGNPCDAREYSLDGSGISQPKAEPVSVCQQCGASYSPQPSCPVCGFVTQKDAKPVRIYNVALAEVYAGAFTPADAQAKELARLVSHAIGKGWSLSWSAREFKRLFGCDPDLSACDPQVKQKEFEALRKQAAEKGYKPGFAAVRFKALFGHWPPR